MDSVRVYNQGNAIYISSKAYPSGSLTATYSGDNITITVDHTSKVVVKNCRYDKIVDKDGNTWGASASAATIALNNYIGAANPDGIIKSTDKITDLTGITASDFASKPGYTVFVGSTDGSLQTSNAVLLDGNNLRVNGELTSGTNANLKLKPGGTGNVEIGNFEFDADQTGANDGDVLTFDSASGTIALSTPTGGSSPWTTSGSDIYYTAGNVGIGTTTPSQPLHVDGNAKINGILDLRNSLDTDAGVIQVTDVGSANVSVGIGNMTSVGTRHIGIGEINNTTRYDYVGIGGRGVGGGHQSVVIGDEVAGNNSSTAIVAIGQNASRFASGSYSVAVGRSALYNTGALGSAYTVAIGESAGSSQSGTYNSFLGKSAGASADGSYSLAAGAYSGANMGQNSVALGAYAAQGDATSTFSNTVAVGYEALKALTTGTQNTAVGNQAGAALTTGGTNTLLGYEAGAALTTQGGNTFIGNRAGYQSTSSSAGSNTFIGSGAGADLTNGAYSGITALGAGAGNNPNTRSIHIGNNAGYNNNGFGTINLGFGAGSYASAGNSVTIGYQANYSSSAANKVGIGYKANAGANSVAIGYQAGENTGSGNIFIGYQAGDGETGSNKLFIENSNSTTPLIYGEFDNDILRVNGTLQVNDPASTGYAFPTATGTLGQVLEVDASGDLVFATPSGGSGGGLGSADQTLTADRLIDTNGYNLAIELDPTGTADTFTIHDGTHDLFQVDTGTTGTIFSVNDVSGLPKLTVDDSDGVTIDKFKEVKYEKPSNTDFSYQGDVVYFGATTGMTQGDLYYYNSSGNWAQADADAASSSGGVLLAIALGTASDTNGMLLKGTFTMAAGAIDGTEATGDELYVSTTAGHITSDVSAYTTGDVVRVVGYCLDGTNGQIWFNPSNDFITLA